MPMLEVIRAIVRLADRGLVQFVTSSRLETVRFRAPTLSKPRPQPVHVLGRVRAANYPRPVRIRAGFILAPRESPLDFMARCASSR